MKEVKNAFEMLYENIQQDPYLLIFGDSRGTVAGREALSIIDSISAQLSSLYEEDEGEGIAILLSRNIYYMSSIFAVWQIGKFFIPLNYDWPEEHLQSILKKANPRLIISDKEIAGYKTLNINGFVKEYSPSEKERSIWECERRKARLAYIIFTSGSTGEQKGVMISHLAYQSYIKWTGEFFKAFADNKSLLITAELTFDITMGDIAFALINKTTIFVSPDTKNLIWHAKLINDYKIDTFYSVPSTINHLFAWTKTRKEMDFSHLKLVISGGDTFSSELIRLVKDVAPHSQFYNVYGPTETTINCAATRVDNLMKKIGESNNLVPIGMPLEHLKPFLYNEGEKYDPQVSDSGELLISGEQCMDGYVGDPELTKKVFIEINNEKFYRTGDLVKKDKEGYYFVLGRIDGLVHR